MSLLKDSLHLLHQSVDLDKEGPWLRAALPILVTAFSSVYASLLVSDGCWFPLYLAIGFIFGALFITHQRQHDPSYRSQALDSTIHSIAPVEISRDKEVRNVVRSLWLSDSVSTRQTRTIHSSSSTSLSQMQSTSYSTTSIATLSSAGGRDLICTITSSLSPPYVHV